MEITSIHGIYYYDVLLALNIMDYNFHSKLEWDVISNKDINCGID
jgi:hypothetical protein